MLVDSHAHYDDSRFDSDRDETLKRVHREGIFHIVNPSSDNKSLHLCLSLARKYPFLHAAAGIHPHFCANAHISVFKHLEECAARKEVVAIGETGLDYHYDNCPRPIQKQWFSRHLELAAELGLPVIIHDREAHRDTAEIVSRYADRLKGGVFHMFSGSAEFAAEVVEMGFHLGIGGVVTFKNAKKIVEVVEYIPEDRLLVETDCPYMAPEPCRGKRNDSGLLKYTVQRIAEIRNTDYERVAEKSSDNAARLFRLDTGSGREV